jgi:hypothetical protein
VAARREAALEQQLNNSDEPPEGPDDTPHVDLPELIRACDEEGFRREAFMYKISGRTLHLWRAFSQARRLGAEVSSLPWFLEHLDEVAGRLHQAVPQSDEEVAKIFEMNGKNRRPAYNDVRDRLAGAVLRWLDDHPGNKLDTAFAAVAERFKTTSSKVKRAYYDLMKKMQRFEK